MDSIQLQVTHLILWNIYLKCKYLPVFRQNLHHIICMTSLIVYTFFGHITFLENITVILKPQLTKHSCSVVVYASKSFETVVIQGYWTWNKQVILQNSLGVCVCMRTVSQSVLYFIQTNIIKPTFYVYMSVSWQ